MWTEQLNILNSYWFAKLFWMQNPTLLVLLRNLTESFIKDKDKGKYKMHSVGSEIKQFFGKGLHICGLKAKKHG